jgi:hypothetical protein
VWVAYVPSDAVAQFLPRLSLGIARYEIHANTAAAVEEWVHQPGVRSEPIRVVHLRRLDLDLDVWVDEIHGLAGELGDVALGKAHAAHCTTVRSASSTGVALHKGPSQSSWRCTTLPARWVIASWTSCGCATGDELEALVRDSSRGAATLCGHTHAATATQFVGKPLLVAPGVHSAGQLPLAVADPNPGLIDEQPPPALSVHHLADESITTYVLTSVTSGAR